MHTDKFSTVLLYVVKESVMTDAHLVPHAFQLSHPLTSSAAWSLLDDSGTDEAEPSLATPFPTIPHPPSSELIAASDSALTVTPERTVSSRVPLQHPVPSLPEYNCEPNHRATKVHFDQTVSVHNLSPEYRSNSESPDDYRYRLSELDIDMPSSSCSTSDIEPISVLASDLRCLSPSSLSLLDELESSRSLQHTSSAGKTLSDNSTRKKKSSSKPSMQLITELGNAGGILAESVRDYPDDDQNLWPECKLAKPGFNSTLKMSNEIAQLQEQQFDLAAVTKEKINPKLKQQLFEKVLLTSFHQLYKSTFTIPYHTISINLLSSFSAFSTSQCCKICSLVFRMNLLLVNSLDL